MLLGFVMGNGALSDFTGLLNVLFVACLVDSIFARDSHRIARWYQEACREALSLNSEPLNPKPENLNTCLEQLSSLHP